MRVTAQRTFCTNCGREDEVSKDLLMRVNGIKVEEVDELLSDYEKPEDLWMRRGCSSSGQQYNV